MLRKDKLDTSIIFLLTVFQKKCDFLNQLNSNLTNLNNYDDAAIIGTYNGSNVYRKILTGSIDASSLGLEITLALGATATRILSLQGTVNSIPFGFYVSSTEYIRAYYSNGIVYVQTCKHGGTVYVIVEYTID